MLKTLGLLIGMLATPISLSPNKVHYNYPYPCCGNVDCGEIVNIILLPDGKRNITIRLWDGTFRSAVFPKDFIVSLPIDNKSHACISYSAEPLCLFGNDEI